MYSYSYWRYYILYYIHHTWCWRDDKGIVRIIMNTSHYEYKLLSLFSSSSYKPLSKNSINSITESVNKEIKCLSLDPSIQKCLISHKAQTPRIYGQFHFHRKYVPLRPIVSAIRATTYALGNFLVDDLQSVVIKTHNLHLDK